MEGTSEALMNALSLITSDSIPDTHDSRKSFGSVSGLYSPWREVGMKEEVKVPAALHCQSCSENTLSGRQGVASDTV